ncbi:hypothetical protein BD779DRAFT_1801257 [Infundibulicybe gibba]|nr:hypothetical protein BD779DRAFT_1801257 [Infundibulicybe gibba]
MSTLLQYTALVLILSFALVQPLSPGAIPLAVRSPYFNCWLPQGAGTPGIQPTFWNGRVFGWTGYIRIDGATSVWLGNIAGSSTLVNTEITPTRTIISLSAGPMDVQVTFLTPIEPTDLVRQSFPFTYVYLTANATDGASHSIQVYSDISAEFVSGDSGNEVAWSTTAANDLSSEVVAWPNGPTMTWQTGSVYTIRDGYRASGGKLNNTEDNDFRAISDNWPIFAFSTDLGNISAISTPLVWALGLYKTIGEAIGAFIQDFPNARQRAINLDQRITSDALSISQNYATSSRSWLDRRWAALTSPSRMELMLLSPCSPPSPPTSIECVLGWPLAEPSLQQQAAALPASAYATPDLGSYPNATGNTAAVNAEALAIERQSINSVARFGEPGYSIESHRLHLWPIIILGLIYNLFSDHLLKLNFINQTIYNDQTVFYMAQISTAAGPYGIPYDSSAPDQVKSHWTMLTAATAVDNISGAAIGKGGRSSPAQGAMFAFLALNLPEQSIQASVPGGGGGGGSGGGNPKPDTGVSLGLYWLVSPPSP